MRRELLEQDPGLANRVYDACVASKTAADQRVTLSRVTNFVEAMLPWTNDLADRDAELLGPDPWAPGATANRVAIETFLRYHHEQGLSPRLSLVCWSASCCAPDVAATSDLIPSTFAAEVNDVTMSGVDESAVKVGVKGLPLGMNHWPFCFRNPLDCRSCVALPPRRRSGRAHPEPPGFMADSLGAVANHVDSLSAMLDSSSAARLEHELGSSVRSINQAATSRWDMIVTEPSVENSFEGKEFEIPAWDPDAIMQRRVLEAQARQRDPRRSSLPRRQPGGCLNHPAVLAGPPEGMKLGLGHTSDRDLSQFDASTRDRDSARGAVRQP